MIYEDVLVELSKYGNAKTKKNLIANGAKEPLYGVKIGDLKKLQMKIKKDYVLSKALYNTGNHDCMYLAGLIADEEQMTKADFKKWIDNAKSHIIAEYTIASIVAESEYGIELALEWIESDNELIGTAGWATLANLAMLEKGTEILDDQWSDLIAKVVLTIGNAKNRVRYSMNNFVIAMGCYNEDLSRLAIEASKKMGRVEVDMKGTACKVPDAESYIMKMIKMGRMGKKKKQARC